MRLHDDLSVPVFVHAARQDWVSSPASGVDRRMLFRVGGEVARATSIVRYAPGSAFPRHVHTGGEEIFVLDGTFQDEHGDYPAGSYLRNPPGTSHAPASKDGCTIFVHLWQFREGDRAQTVSRPGEGQRVEPCPGTAGAAVLFDDGHEKVRLEHWQPGQSARIANRRGLEFLVLSGSANIGDEPLERQSWGRLPAGLGLVATAGPQGAEIWMKDAALRHPDVCRLPS